MLFAPVHTDSTAAFHRLKSAIFSQRRMRYFAQHGLVKAEEQLASGFHSFGTTLSQLQRQSGIAS